DGSPDEQIGRLLAMDPPPPSAVRAGAAIPPDLDRIVLRALAKRPEDRFQSAEEFERALGALFSEDFPGLLRSEAPRGSARPKPRRPWVALAAAVIVAAVAVPLAVQRFRGPAPLPRPEPEPAAAAAPAPALPPRRAGRDGRA